MSEDLNQKGESLSSIVTLFFTFLALFLGYTIGKGIHAHLEWHLAQFLAGLFALVGGFLVFIASFIFLSRMAEFFGKIFTRSE